MCDLVLSGLTPRTVEIHTICYRSAVAVLNNFLLMRDGVERTTNRKIAILVCVHSWPSQTYRRHRPSNDDLPEKVVIDMHRTRPAAALAAGGVCFCAHLSLIDILGAEFGQGAFVRGQLEKPAAETTWESMETRVVNHVPRVLVRRDGSD